ncbi:MAG: zeta toxin family protein [Rickettsiales bacterium]|jgi:predicted ABC-type ATPase|nr:zeta toxin family protein [Rickettsiales bacterium]
MLLVVSEFIAANQAAIDTFAAALNKAHHLEIELENHQFPKEVRREMESALNHEARKITASTNQIMALLKEKGQSSAEALQSYRIIYSKLTEKSEKHEAEEAAKNGGKEKWMWIVGGPNGAGKSTFVASEYGKLAGFVPLVNPDDIAAEMSPHDVTAVQNEAGRRAIERMREYAEQGRSFIVESTLAGNFHMKLARELKEKGWHIGMVYITNDSPQTSLARVRLRVSKGGHDVPDEDVVRRWEKSHEKLADHLRLTDLAYILDNSTREGFALVGSGKGGKVALFRKELLPHVTDNITKNQLVVSLSDLTRFARTVKEILPSDQRQMGA